MTQIIKWLQGASERTCVCVCVEGPSTSEWLAGNGVRLKSLCVGSGFHWLVLYLHNSQRLLENEVTTYKLHPVRCKMEANKCDLGLLGWFLLARMRTLYEFYTGFMYLSPPSRMLCLYIHAIVPLKQSGGGHSRWWAVGQLIRTSPYVHWKQLFWCKNDIITQS